MNKVYKLIKYYRITILNHVGTSNNNKCQRTHAVFLHLIVKNFSYKCRLLTLLSSQVLVSLLKRTILRIVQYLN